MTLLFLPVALPLLFTLLFRLKQFSRPMGIAVYAIAAMTQICLGAEIVLRTIRSGVLTLSFGAWPAPYGVFLVGDELAGLAICASAFLLFCAGICADTQRANALYVRISMLSSAVALVVLSGDMGLLVLGIGWLLFSLLGAESTWRPLPEFKSGGFNDVIFSVFLLSAVAIFIYSITGAFNFAEIYESLKMIPGEISVTLIGFFMLLSAFIACKQFPFFSQLSGHVKHGDFAVPSLLLGSVAIVFFVIAHRMTQLLFSAQPVLSTCLFWAGIGTVIAAALYAVSETRAEASLTGLGLSRFGFVLVFLSVGSAHWHALAILMVFELCLLLPALALLIGCSVRNRMNTVLFGLTCATLLGILPLSGFWFNIHILDFMGWKGVAVKGTAILSALLYALVLFKLWISHFVKQQDSSASPSLFSNTLLYICLVALLGFGVYFASLYDFADNITSELLNANRYSNAVFNTGVKL